MFNRSIRTPAFSIAIIAGAFLSACERDPSPRVTTSQPKSVVPASKPDSPRPPIAETPASAPPPAMPPADEVPNWLDVLDRGSSDKPVRVRSHVKGSNELILTTENLGRMRLRNDGFPVGGKGSVILRIDNKTIEWLRTTPTIELERTPNGDWIIPAPPKKP